jgi:uncharacterized protein (TIGR03118 family)
MPNRSPRVATFGLLSLLAAGAALGVACSGADFTPSTTTDSGAPGDASGDTGAPVSMPFPATATKLTGDDDVLGAAHADPNLLNAWGLAFGPTGIAWISGNRSNKALLYDALGAPQAIVVDVPPGAAGADAAPTGQIYNGDASSFLGDEFIIAGEDGAIAGWSADASATVRIDNSSVGARYTGLALVAPVTTTSQRSVELAAGKRLVATDFHNARVDVFDALYQPIASAGAFVDAQIPAGYAPFNAAQIGGEVYVTYAKQDAKAKRDLAGPGNGYVSVFDAAGAFLRRFDSGGLLDSPWAIARVPDDAAALPGKILIGNFGDGVVLVYETDGTAVGLLTDASANRLFIDGLRSLVFFTPSGGAPTLFFTAGPGAQAHGLFGRIDVASPGG